jgi:hypothetical protein
MLVLGILSLGRESNGERRTANGERRTANDNE